ncbi:MAG: hypothetical protein Hals2KO_12970 [Halioglobus sp.]
MREYIEGKFGTDWREKIFRKRQNQACHGVILSNRVCDIRQGHYYHRGGKAAMGDYLLCGRKR